MVNEETVFFQALAIESAADRAAVLDEACGDDSRLRDEVAKLLRLHERAGSFLERPALELQRTVIANREASEAAAAVGGADAVAVVGGRGPQRSEVTQQAAAPRAARYAP